MSNITDLYIFTKELDKYSKLNDTLPQASEFHKFIADVRFKGNRRLAEKLANMAASDKYRLISLDRGGYYSLDVRGYNLIKGALFFRPGLVFFFINECSNPLAIIISTAALLVAILTAVYK